MSISMNDLYQLLEPKLFEIFDRSTESFNTVDIQMANEPEWNTLNEQDKRKLFNIGLTNYQKPLAELLNRTKAMNVINEQYVEIAKYFLNKYFILTDPYSKDIWIYKNGIYNSNGEMILMQKLHEHFPKYTTHGKREVLDKIRIPTYFIDGINPFDKFNVIVVKNGVILLDRLNEPDFFRPHNQVYMASRKIDILYNPKVECPNIDSFFKQVTIDDIEMELYLIEALADCLTNHYKSQKFHIFNGDGDNGKGAWLRVMAKFLGGKSNVSSLTLPQLTGTSFQLHLLQFRLANIIGEASSNHLKDTSTIKTVTGEDYITCDVKNQRKPLEFSNTAKFFLSTQYIPKTPDESRGYIRRISISEWNYVVEKRIDGFEESLQTDTEMSGLLNRVLIGYKDLADRNYQFKFDEGKTPDEKLDYYLIKSNPVKVFIERYLEENESMNEPIDKVFKAWDKFRISISSKIMNKNGFGKAMKDNIKDIKISKPTIDMVRVRCYDGWKLNEAWYEFLKEDQTDDLS